MGQRSWSILRHSNRVISERERTAYRRANSREKHTIQLHYLNCKRYLLICGLFSDVVSISAYIATSDCIMMNEWERICREVVVAYLGYYHDTCLKVLNKTIKTRSQDSHCPSRDLNREPSEYSRNFTA